MGSTLENTSEKNGTDIGRRTAVPIIYTRGTHYDIGFDIGRTFGKLINDYMNTYVPLLESYLPVYETEAGKKVYEETLACVEEQYPGYVREIRGTADGAQVPFHKLFLMHLDEIVPNVAAGTQGNDQPVGCSSIMCNQPGQEILGHNEDALRETLNHWYLVSAHVIEPGSKEEKFMSLSYAGFLPGYTMGYNHHGLVYSINTLSAATLRSGKTPRYFLTRALLAAENFAEAERTLRNEGYGAADGFSINLTFLEEEGGRIFRNIEIAPCKSDCNQSQMDIHTLAPGEDSCFHCNTYRRLKVPEIEGLIIDSSVKRMAAISNHPHAQCRQDVIEILSDQTDDQFRVYQEIKPDDYVKTLATGIFDCIAKTWTIYSDKPNSNEPMVVLPIHLAEKSPTVNGEVPEACQKCEACETTEKCEEAGECHKVIENGEATTEKPDENGLECAKCEKSCKAVECAKCEIKEDCKTGDVVECKNGDNAEATAECNSDAKEPTEEQAECKKTEESKAQSACDSCPAAKKE